MTLTATWLGRDSYDEKMVGWTICFGAKPLTFITVKWNRFARLVQSQQWYSYSNNYSNKSNIQCKLINYIINPDDHSFAATVLSKRGKIKE